MKDKKESHKLLASISVSSFHQHLSGLGIEGGVR
jgi:hypothetical protein